MGQFEVKAQSVIAYIKNQEITEKMLEGHIGRMTGKLKGGKSAESKPERLLGAQYAGGGHYRNQSGRRHF
ncbi:siphovirus Gp157 family protein [Neisseria gonorrhoeae]|nr:siphovirus Gp157 family protein [Neisseria gonorrhoeae]